MRVIEAICCYASHLSLIHEWLFASVNSLAVIFLNTCNQVTVKQVHTALLQWCGMCAVSLTLLCFRSVQFLQAGISQGSVVTRLRCGGTFMIASFHICY